MRELTVAEWNRKWLGEARHQLRASSAAQYEDAIHSILNPEIGSIPLKELDEDTGSRMVLRLIKEGRGPSRIELAVTVQSLSLQSAFELGMVDYNSFKLVNMPSRMKKNTAILRENDIKKMMTECKDMYLAPMFVIMLLCGLRIGEALALKWEDINMRDNTMIIRRQLVRYRKDGHNVYSVNDYTKNGVVDTVVYPHASAEWLNMEKVLQDGWRNNLPQDWEGYAGYVFTDERGAPVKYDAAYYRYRKIMDRIGRPDMTIHGLRHTAASVALYAGRDRLAVREYLRDRSLNTVDGYIHVTHEQKLRLADVLHDYFAPLARTAIGEEYCYD